MAPQAWKPAQVGVSGPGAKNPNSKSNRLLRFEICGFFRARNLEFDDCVIHVLNLRTYPPFPSLRIFPFEQGRFFWHKGGFMNMKHTLSGLLLALLVSCGFGCQKSISTQLPAAPKPSVLSPGTVLRVHWRGRDDLGIMAGAYYFMRIWQLPQSGQVEVQALAKLSTAPWRFLPGENDANVTSNSLLLYPLLGDVVWNESCFEIRQASNQPAEYVFAIRMDAAHQQLWQTNLAAIVHSLTGIEPVPASGGQFGWSLEKTGPPIRVQLSRVGQWTLVSAGPKKNALLNEVTARIRRDHTPCAWQVAGDWLEADADIPRLRSLLPHSVRTEVTRLGLLASSPTDSTDWNLAANLSRISLAVNGDGAHVLTHANLTFSKPLPADLQSWTVPTNLIHPPLMSFTAARGLKPWLASWKTWSDLRIGPPPDQIYSWSAPAGVFQTYFAAPLPAARGEVQALSEHLLQKANPWLAARGYFGFEPGSDSNGVVWGRSSAIRPFVKSAAADDAGGVVYGGLIPETEARAGTNFFYYHPSFPELLDNLSGLTNLVYYHWELTGPRIQSCLYIGQFLSAITRQKPLPLDSTAAVWLKIVQPRLGNTTTALTLTAPNQLSFSRRSTVGFTAAELNFLAAWLESPQFPEW
jgi:hypothetical protein